MGYLYLIYDSIIICVKDDICISRIQVLDEKGNGRHKIFIFIYGQVLSPRRQNIELNQHDPTF